MSGPCRRFLRSAASRVRRTPAPRRQGRACSRSSSSSTGRWSPRISASTSPGNGDTSSRSGSTSRSWSPREPTPPRPPWPRSSYPIGTASGAATVTAVSRGAALVSTAVLYQRLPTVIYGLADQGVDAPADLAGKRVGVHPDSTTRHEFAVFLGIAGVRAEDISPRHEFLGRRRQAALRQQRRRHLGARRRHRCRPPDSSASYCAKSGWGTWNHGDRRNRRTHLGLRTLA